MEMDFKFFISLSNDDDKKVLRSKISQVMCQGPKYYKFKKKNPFGPSKKEQGLNPSIKVHIR